MSQLSNPTSMPMDLPAPTWTPMSEPIPAPTIAPIPAPMLPPPIPVPVTAPMPITPRDLLLGGREHSFNIHDYSEDNRFVHTEGDCRYVLPQLSAMTSEIEARDTGNTWSTMIQTDSQVGSKLRGDAPVFVPQKQIKQWQPRSRETPWMVVTSS
ncbi:hypothetical protein BDV25DRAFT_140803 [Aspergillus avenaceus]|uniref:Uncharacterized protein n=1 Tax=Aspergillus avenaceus TaxID=36643 RepID=A0A5N6TST9_ASPAV|nr:hypothetical protein BDV25DRAFT_140803 [Aspergillus avenaceus]